MSKKFLVVGILISLFILSVGPVVAQQKTDVLPDIPERNGVYNDPGHPGIKVRVFVHPEKPERVTLPSLVCSLSDPDSPSTVNSAGWHLPSNWIYNLNPSSVPSSVGGTNLPSIAGNGFSDWQSAALGQVIFTRGADTNVVRQAYDGKNIVAWGRTSGTALGVTYVRYYSSTGLAVDVDTIMNKKFAWKWSNSSSCGYSEAYDAENILTHELGHWMGLDDEYDVFNYGNATMYGYGSKGEVKKSTLTSGDVNGIQSVY